IAKKLNTIYIDKIRAPLELPEYVHTLILNCCDDDDSPHILTKKMHTLICYSYDFHIDLPHGLKKLFYDGSKKFSDIPSTVEEVEFGYS
ncbi:hypothetical protein ACI3PL_23990, partial [Lacticaseibacillus paracasei]